MSADRIVHAISGGIGGAAALVVTYPLVAVSCHQQTIGKKTKPKQEDTTPESEAAKVDPEKEEIEKETEKKLEQKLNESSNASFLSVVKQLWKANGVKSFYSGMESAIYGMALTNFIYYYFYETSGRVLIRNRGIYNPLKFRLSKLSKITMENLSTKESMLIGLIAGSITAIMTNPFWVLNTRTTVAKGEKKSFLQALVSIYKEEGIKAFFNGVIPALVLVINPIIQYTFFEQAKNWISKKRKAGINPFDAFLIGALSKLVATGTTYPYITLKSRMHLLKDKAASITTFSLIADIFKNEGIAGFYNGIFVKLSQSIATAAFLFFFKEELVHLTVKLLRVTKRKKL